MHLVIVLGLIVVLTLMVALVVRASRAPAAADRAPARTPGGLTAGNAIAFVRPDEPVAAEPASGDAVSPPGFVVPASLADFQWRTAEDLPRSRREGMLAALTRAPPPPRAFHQLVSPEFVAKASSQDLAEIVISVPLAATRVLARANSAFYGLQKPVGNVGQAITLLGLNSVRTLCLQYMMEASFKADTPALKQRFDQLWAASAIAAELAQKLAYRLQLPEPGGLVTEVALSSLGHFAVATQMPDEASAAITQSLLARSWAEQSRLGAPAAEFGALLMRAWELPEVLIEDVRAIDRMLVTPAGQLEPPRCLRLAAGYLSARLGERLARGDEVNVDDFDRDILAGDDCYFLRAALQPEQQQRLREAMRSPDVKRSLQAMMSNLREPAARAGAA